MPGMRYGGVHGDYVPLATSEEGELDETVLDDENATAEVEHESLLPEIPVATETRELGPTGQEYSFLRFFDKIKKCTPKVVIFILTNWLVSVFVLMFGMGLSIGLGYYALKVVQPNIVIDKSLNSFNIPNHISSQRADALKVAISDLYSHHKRKKRNIQDILSQHERNRRDTEDTVMNNFNYFSLPKDNTFSLNFGNQGESSQTYTGNNAEVTSSSNIYASEKSENIAEDGSATLAMKTQRSQNLLEEFDKYVDSYDVSPEEKQSKSPGELFYEKHFKERLEKASQPKSWLERIVHHIQKRSSGGTYIVNANGQYLLTWRMMLVYIAHGSDENIFTEDRLETIHKIEKRITQHPEFTKFCWKVRHQIQKDPSLQQLDGCMPPNSLLSYFYPSTYQQKVHFDGLGNQITDVHDGLMRAMVKKTFYWYVDEKMNSTNKKSRLLRSEVYFGTPLQGYKTRHDRRNEQHDKFKKFVITYIDSLSQSSTEKVRVLYGGNEIYDYEVDSTFWHDMLKAFVSMGCIFVFMLILTSFSVWLTFMGLVSIVLCFPLALYFYRVIFGIKALGILNGAAAFLIIGIGVDDVFVFVNTFRQAHQIKDLGERQLHTIKTAGLATFFTSFTTAAAFAANVASSIPALHEFGLFMSLIVSCCWVMVVIMMPPSLNIWYKLFSKWETWCSSCLKRSPRNVGPNYVARFIPINSDRRANSSVPEDEDDVPILAMDPVTSTPALQLESDDDDPLLLLESELEADDTFSSQIPQIAEDRVSPTNKREGFGFTLWIQGLLNRFIAVPVVKGRWIVFALYFILMAVSIGLVTQLKPATKPPQLFRDGTNLQLLLDLKANLSAEGISCDTCSGLFIEGADTYKPPPAPTSFNTFPTVRHTTTSTTTPSPLEPPKTTRPSHLIPEKTDKPTPKKKTSIRHTTTVSTRAATTTTKRTTPHPTHRIFSTRRVFLTTPVPKRVSTVSSTVNSVSAHFNPCSGNKCDKAADRPVLENGATVYVVFGLKGIDRTGLTNEHVLKGKGKVIYDKDFHKAFNFTTGAVNPVTLQELCKVCKYIANYSTLVKPNSAQCLPFDASRYSGRSGGIYSTMTQYLALYEECRDLPSPRVFNHRLLPKRAFASLNISGLYWIAFAYESTTNKGQSYFEAYKEYQAWEKLITDIKTNIIAKDSPLQDMFQTSEFWTKVFMEVVAVGSAIYGLALSMIICIAAVAIFTGNFCLMLIIVMTIGGIILLVVCIFFIVGWELGAVEAVSLSILVGSSVDYCVHLVEGYLLAGKQPPQEAMESNMKLRGWRAKAAISHIGVSILSSAVTTIIAAIPLTMTTIQPFAKFGQIVAINTTVAIIYTLAACTALLSIFGPAKYIRNLKSTIVAFLITAGVIGLAIAGLFSAYRLGVVIPGPNGDPLFS